MAEGANDLKQFIIKEAVRAGIWGVAFFVVTGILLLVVKQEIKEGIDYAVKRSSYEMVKYATDPYLIGKAKQLVKEGVEYALDKAGNKYEQVMIRTHNAVMQSGQMGNLSRSKMSMSQ